MFNKVPVEIKVINEIALYLQDIANKKQFLNFRMSNNHQR